MKKYENIVGETIIKNQYKKVKIIGAFNVDYLKELFKRTKGKEINGVLYILYDKKKEELYPAIVLLRKGKMGIVAPITTEYTSLNELKRFWRGI